MRNYYVCFDKYPRKGQRPIASWIIAETSHNLDTVTGLLTFIEDLEEEHDCDVRIVNWKLLDAPNP